MAETDSLSEVLKPVSISETALSRRAAALYRGYRNWSKPAPKKSAGSNADANRRPRRL